MKEKRATFLGKARSCDPQAGLCHIQFNDGEWEEFNDAEMECFHMAKSHTPRAPTANANQIIAPGCFPQATTSDKRMFCGMQAGLIWDEELSQWMAHQDLIDCPNPVMREQWIKAGINEFARLAHGHDKMEGMDVVSFIREQQVPNGKTVTHAQNVVDHCPEKDEPWRLRITCGGDKSSHSGETATHSATVETIKCQLNDIVSDHQAKAATGDISNMCWGSDLPEHKCVRFRADLIPSATKKDGCVCAQVNKAWCGLKQAGHIAHNDLVQRPSAETKVIKNAMASAAEAEIGAPFMNAQEAVGSRNCLEAIGHPQPPTPLKTDNSTANGIIDNTVKQKRSKATDARFHWLQDGTKQGQFCICWDSGKHDHADFHTKHHPVSCHRTNRPVHAHIEGVSPSSQQGCVRMMNKKRQKH